MKRLLSSVLLMLAANGCATWHRQPVGGLEGVRQGEVVEVWRGRRVVKLKAIRLTADSLSGVPFFRETSCDSCRITMARAEVDSVRVQQRDENRSLLLGGILLAVFVFLFWFGANLASLKD